MSKIKKWIYPLIFLLSSVVGLLLFYVLLLALVASKIFTNGWGALFVLLIAVLLWGFILLPLYCLKYGKRVQAERFSVFFVFYNAFVIVMPFVLPLIRYEETYAYGFISFLWVVGWAAFPLLSAREIRKGEERAKKAVFEAIGVAADEVAELTVTTTKDNIIDGWAYCLTFTVGDTRYRAEVNGQTGEIVRIEKENGL